MNRRSFLRSLLAIPAAACVPFWDRPKLSLSQMSQFLWKKHWSNVGRAVNEGKVKLALEHSEMLEKAMLGLEDL